MRIKLVKINITVNKEETITQHRYIANCRAEGGPGRFAKLSKVQIRGGGDPRWFIGNAGADYYEGIYRTPEDCFFAWGIDNVEISYDPVSFVLRDKAECWGLQPGERITCADCGRTLVTDNGPESDEEIYYAIAADVHYCGTCRDDYAEG